MLDAAAKLVKPLQQIEANDRVNLEPADEVAEVLSQWLATIDDGESGFKGVNGS